MKKLTQIKKDITMLTLSQLFKLAHKMTKQIIQKGDSYQATFGLCLKLIKAHFNKNVTSLSAELYRAKANSRGVNSKGDKLDDLINNELVKMILKRNEIKVIIKEISFISKVKLLFKVI